MIFWHRKSPSPFEEQSLVKLDVLVKQHQELFGINLETLYYCTTSKELQLLDTCGFRNVYEITTANFPDIHKVANFEAFQALQKIKNKDEKIQLYIQHTLDHYFSNEKIDTAKEDITQDFVNSVKEELNTKLIGLLKSKKGCKDFKEFTEFTNQFYWLLQMKEELEKIRINSIESEEETIERIKEIGVQHLKLDKDQFLENVNALMSTFKRESLRI